MPIKRGLFGGNFRKFFPEKGWNLKNFSLKVGVALISFGTGIILNRERLTYDDEKAKVGPLLKKWQYKEKVLMALCRLSVF